MIPLTGRLALSGYASELSVLLLRLSVESHDEFENLLSTIDIDLYDALGIRRMESSRLQVSI